MAARIGWLLRISRMAAGVSLADMAERVGEHELSMSVPTISTLERRGVRDGLVIDTYERALALPPGHLRAPIDVACRGFAESPPDRRPDPLAPVGLDEFDRAADPVHGPSPTGGDWLTFARTLRRAGGLVTSRHMRPLVDQLLDELVRSVGVAFVTRYEAIAQLRCERYADIVEDAVRELTLGEGSQVVAINALSAVSELPTTRLLEWTASLLKEESPWRQRGAAYAISNMRSVGGLADDDFDLVVPSFLQAHQAASGDPARRSPLTVLFKSLPVGARRLIQQQLTSPLEPVPGPTSWDAHEENKHYTLCEELADDVCAEHGLGSQPMLTRLLFEVIFDFRAARVTGAAFMLMASPVIDALQPRLLELAVHHDPATRTGALRALHHVQVPRGTEQIQAWFDTTMPLDDAAALLVAGNAGIRLPDELVDTALSDSEFNLRAVEAMGLCGHPGLQRIATDRQLDPTVRAIAAWWVEHGPRVVA